MADSRVSKSSKPQSADEPNGRAERPRSAPRQRLAELRKLLVGSELGDVQQHLDRFEAKMDSAFRQLQEDTQRRVETLEALLREEVAAIRAQFEARHNEAQQRLAGERDQVQRSKVDRASLASMLRDLASRVDPIDEAAQGADLEDLLDA